MCICIDKSEIFKHAIFGHFSLINYFEEIYYSWNIIISRRRTRTRVTIDNLFIYVINSLDRQRVPFK